MKKITELTAELAAPVIAERGCTLWDVEYVKEAGTWYLRVLLDKEGGVDILDCEAVSRRLSDLLRELEQIPGISWIRLHYLYPDEMDDELLETVAASRKVLHYFDIPIQHINDRILRDMNRRGGGQLIRERIRRLRTLMPDAILRTSLIVGFPGETEEEFQELYDFLEQYRLERVGIFCYSQEEGSPAAEMPDQIPEEVKERRQAELYALQERIMDDFSQKQIGRTLEVLCCGRDEDGRCFGRSYMDSVEIDGQVYFESEDAREGAIVPVRIDYAEGCDLYGRVV